MKEKKKKLDFLEIKNFCSANDTVKKMKREATDWKKLFAKHASDVDFYPKYAKKSYNSTVIQQKTQLKNEQKI